RNLVISGGAVSFDIDLALPEAVPEAEVRQVAGACERAVKGLDDVTSVHVAARARVARASGGRTVMPQVRDVVAVASGKGGVGKSTTAADLALALAAEGDRVGLLDADIYGPSLPLMLGASGRPEPIASDRVRPV